MQLYELLSNGKILFYIYSTLIHLPSHHKYNLEMNVSLTYISVLQFNQCLQECQPTPHRRWAHPRHSAPYSLRTTLNRSKTCSPTWRTRSWGQSWRPIAATRTPPLTLCSKWTATEARGGSIRERMRPGEGGLDGNKTKGWGRRLKKTAWRMINSYEKHNAYVICYVFLSDLVNNLH